MGQSSDVSSPQLVGKGRSGGRHANSSDAHVSHGTTGQTHMRVSGTQTASKRRNSLDEVPHESQQSSKGHA